MPLPVLPRERVHHVMLTIKAAGLVYKTRTHVLQGLNVG